MLVERGNSGKRGVTNVVWKCFAQVNFNIRVERTCGILAQCGHHEEASAVRSILAEVPQVDHRIGQRFEGVVQPAEAIEPKQQTPKFIFPAEHPLDGVEPLFENGGVEERLAASLGASSTAGIRVDIGDHPAIENGFAVNPAIVDAIQADDSSFKVNANSIGDARHQRQGFPQKRRFIAIARRRNKRRDHIAMPIAEGDDLIAFHFLVTAETDVVAALLRRCRRSVAVDDRDVEEIGSMKLQHRACKNGIKTAVRLPLSKCDINARVVNFWTALLIFFDWQFFPLAPQIKQSQNVVEDRMQGQFRRRAPAPNGKMGQDKLLELLETQFRRNPCCC